jgi:hypothetical protein
MRQDIRMLDVILDINNIELKNRQSAGIIELGIQS